MARDTRFKVLGYTILDRERWLEILGLRFSVTQYLMERDGSRY